MLQNTGGSRKNISKISNMAHQFSACGGLEHWFLNIYFLRFGAFEPDAGAEKCISKVRTVGDGSEFSRGQLEKLSVTGAKFSISRTEHYWWNLKVFPRRRHEHFRFTNRKLLIKLKIVVCPPQARNFPFYEYENIDTTQNGFARRRLEKYFHNW